MSMRVLVPMVFFFITCLLMPSNANADMVTDDTKPTCESIEYFYTGGCPHCKHAASYLDDLKQRHPEIDIKRVDILGDTYGQYRFFDLNERFGIYQPGVPFMVMCERYVIGFDSVDTTGQQIEQILGLLKIPVSGNETDDRLTELPLVGMINIDQYGLSLFTIIIGLIDGFNPCALWVLLFLLSLLVNLKSRTRIIIIAGTFVLVSGLVYFAFMAAWLNLFLMVGFSRLLQIMVGLIAVLIGTVHLKDYFAFKKGISLSIPESAKPGLYERMRDVIYARNLWASLVAVIVLAILVNMIELLCTAGLPAVYTQILTSHQLSTVKYYAYLMLYNIAYIFDDALMVFIVVYTLSRSRITEITGRFLKLISGIVITVLGICLLIFPHILI